MPSADFRSAINHMPALSLHPTGLSTSSYKKKNPLLAACYQFRVFLLSSRKTQTTTQPRTHEVVEVLTSVSRHAITAVLGAKHHPTRQASKIISHSLGQVQKP